MTYLILIFAAIFGAILGSFLNALSFRFNTGKNVLVSMSGRSRCMRCGHELGAADLVPIFSWIFLRGRCRYCHSKISWQYPLVEAAAALLSLLIYLQYPQPLWYLFWLLVWMTLLFVVIYDTRHTIIPWSCSGLLAVLAVAYLLLHTTSALGWWAGPILAVPLFLISFVSWGRWMGWGDSVLELSLGWFLGVTLGLTALALAFWIGALVGLALVALTKLRVFSGVTMRSEVPFAPFLILGAALAFFAHVDLFQALPYLF